MSTTTTTLISSILSLPSLLYRGPSVEDLQTLAKQHRIDVRAPIRAAEEVLVRASRPQVWRVLSDLVSWPAWGFGVTQMSLPHDLVVDREFSWTNAGVPLTSRLAVIDPEEEISWTSESYGVRVIHRITVADAGPNGTLLRSEESMSAPLLSLIYPSSKLSRDLRAFVGGLRHVAENLPPTSG